MADQEGSAPTEQVQEEKTQEPVTEQVQEVPTEDAGKTEEPIAEKTDPVTQTAPEVKQEGDNS